MFKLIYGVFVDVNSPQAIFKDPFRRGNNILVSSYVFSQYTTVIFWIVDGCNVVNHPS